MARKISGDKVEMETNDFAPIPNGRYLCDVFDVTVREYGPNSKNAGREYYAIQLRVAEGKYDNRRVFANVGLFPAWASGSDNFMFFQFFAALRGISSNELRKEYNENGELSIPDPEDIMGYQVQASVKVVANDWKGEVTDRNEVNGFLPAKKGQGGPVVTNTTTELDL